MDIELNFPAYLEAKFRIDTASLNARVRNEFHSRIAGIDSPRILDLGTGTGSMLRRLVEIDLTGNALLVGLEVEEHLVGTATANLRKSMEAKGYSVRVEGDRLIGSARGRNLEIRIVHADILKPITRGLPETGFHCVTAQSFMDIVPIDTVLDLIKPRLVQPGLVYASLNYDGVTALFPPWPEEEFEGQLLECYDRSMEARMVGQRKTGGRLSARRLHRHLVDQGFQILALGSSDWSLFPIGGRYEESEILFLKTLVALIIKEASKSGGFEGEMLDSWYRQRRREAEESTLAAVVHQVDILAALERNISIGDPG